MKVQRTEYLVYNYKILLSFVQILTNVYKIHQDVITGAGTLLEASFVHVMMGIDYIMMIQPFVLVCDH